MVERFNPVFLHTSPSLKTRGEIADGFSISTPGLFESKWIVAHDPWVKQDAVLYYLRDSYGLLGQVDIGRLLAANRSDYAYCSGRNFSKDPLDPELWNVEHWGSISACAIPIVS
jgi:hypothetical protein